MVCCELSFRKCFAVFQSAELINDQCYHIEYPPSMYYSSALFCPFSRSVKRCFQMSWLEWVRFQIACNPPPDAGSLAKSSYGFLRGSLSFSCTRHKMDIRCPQNVRKREHSVVTLVVWLHFVLFKVTWKFRSRSQSSR